MHVCNLFFHFNSVLFMLLLLLPLLYFLVIFFVLSLSPLHRQITVWTVIFPTPYTSPPIPALPFLVRFGFFASLSSIANKSFAIVFHSKVILVCGDTMNGGRDRCWCSFNVPFGWDKILQVWTKRKHICTHSRVCTRAAEKQRQWATETGEL